MVYQREGARGEGGRLVVSLPSEVVEAIEEALELFRHADMKAWLPLALLERAGLDPTAVIPDRVRTALEVGALRFECAAEILVQLLEPRVECGGAFRALHVQSNARGIEKRGDATGHGQESER